MTVEADYRLPRTVVPSRYEMTLEPDLGNATFTGSQTVAVEVLEPVNEVVLNAIELVISAVAMVNSSGNRS